MVETVCYGRKRRDAASIMAAASATASAVSSGGNSSSGSGADSVIDVTVSCFAELWYCMPFL